MGLGRDPRRLAAVASLVAASALACAANAQTPAVPAGPGAPPPAAPGVAVGATAQPAPAALWTDAQIRQAFELADANSDGRLSRAEAQRLPLLPLSFEDADRNKDGVLDLAEYRGAFGR